LGRLNEQKMSLKNISILGCGWLGFPLAKFLISKGYSIRGSTTSASKIEKLKEAGIIPFQIKVADTLEGENIDTFFQSDILILNIPPGRRQANVVKSHPKQIQLICDAAQKGSIQKILFISSTGVFANENKIIKEKDLPNPTRDSGKALVKAEAIIQNLENIESTILRMSGLAGGDRKAGRFLAGKKDIPNGMARVNMVHLDDCIQVIYEVLRQAKWDEIFHVSADEHPTRKDFYTSQAIQQGFEIPHFAEETKPASFKIISNEKLKKALSYQFIYPDPMKF